MTAAHAATGLSTRAPHRGLALTFVLGTLLTASTVSVSMVPDLHFDGWRWVLVGVAVLAVALAVPVHREAAAELARHRLGPGALGSLGLVVALAATVVETFVDATPTMAVAVVASAALLSLVLRWRGQESLVDVPSAATLVVAAGAVAAGAGWAVVDSPERGLLVAASVLVAAGPAAALCAGPAALRSARAGVARRDVGLPHPAAVAEVAAADVVLLDKDGTVTTGGLRVTSVDPVEPDHDRNLRWFAGALEHERDDRVARAISRLSGRGRVTEVQSHGDAGVSGRVDRHPVRVGDPTWLGLQPRPGTWTTLAVEVDARVLGTLTVGDDVRPDAADGVQALRDLGLDVALRSPDTDARTREVGLQVGVSDAAGDVDVAGQQADVETRSREGQRVLHVAPSTTLADDLGLPDLDVLRVATALRASRSAVRAARRGLVVALTCTAVAGALAAAGLLGPGLASVAAGVSAGLTTLSAGSRTVS